MKKVTLLKMFIGIVLCYLQQNALAQSKWQYGVYAGGNISKLSPQKLLAVKEYPFADSYKWTPSFNLGLNLDLLVSKKVYFESGINIISKNANAVTMLIFKESRGFYNANNVFERFTKSYYRDFNYKSVAFQIPLSIHLIVFQKNDFKSNLYAGILWENIFSHKLDLVETSEWDAIPPEYLLKEVQLAEQRGYLPGYRNDDTVFDKSNIGSLFGFGCSFKKIGIDIGMNNPVRVYQSIQFKNSSLTFNLRYQIK